MAEYHRHLPHFHPEDAYLFLTWRLWGSLPSKNAPARYSTPGRAFVGVDRALHRAAHGPVWLNDPRIARIVAEAIVDGELVKRFYELDAWVIMPNHVHLLILPLVPTPKIMRWLKGSTARLANRLLHRTGHAFWQDESYDHWARNQVELGRIARYIEENPVNAGLVASMDLWPWSSATWTRESSVSASPQPLPLG
jgi:REP element-mobilizing transposase RayT